MKHISAIPLKTAKNRTYVQRSIELINKQFLSKEDKKKLKSIKDALSTTKFCFYCQSDCSDEYYLWSHKSLKFVKDGSVKKAKQLIICPNCYNTPLKPHGTFGKKMVHRGRGIIEKHTADGVIVII